MFKAVKLAFETLFGLAGLLLVQDLTNQLDGGPSV